MTFFVEVTDTVDESKVYDNRKSPARQHCWLHQDEPYPIKFRLAVDEAKGPLKPGPYLLWGAPFTASEYGFNFRNNEIVLLPLQEGLDRLKAAVADKAKAAGDFDPLPGKPKG